MKDKKNVVPALKIAEVLIQKDEECSDYLTRPLFQVNMRLFKSLDAYKKIVLSVVDHMKNLMKIEKFKDYPKLAGISGANVGIPWNIIVVRLPGSKNELLTMINPVIYKMSHRTSTVESNCGSLNLPKKIRVKRREWVEVSYFDEAGKNKIRKFTMEEGCCGTVQHEIDHNRGVLITDAHCHL